MRILEDTFVILHIKISHIRIYKFSASSLVTLGLVFFISFGLLQVYLAALGGETFRIVDFIESVLYVGLVTYVAIIWLKSWPEAMRMLSKSCESGGDKKDNEKCNESE